MHTTIFLHPATLAGISCIRKDDINGAEPPGTYRPTVSIDLNSFQRVIPLVVSIDEELKFFLSSSQINLILFEESRIAFFKSSETEFSDLFISAALTLKDFIFGSFNSSLIMLKALVPFLIIKSLYLKAVFSISLELIVEDFQLIGNFDFDLFINFI